MKRVCEGSSALMFAVSTAALAALRRGLERRRTNCGDDLLVLRRFHRDDRVAGVDRATEFVGRFRHHHIAHLTRRRGAPRRAASDPCRRSSTDRTRASSSPASAATCGASTAASGSAFARFSTLRTRFTPCNRRRLSRNFACRGREDRDVDLRAADRARAGHAPRRRGVQLAVRMLCDDEYFRHHTNPFCLSTATSSATSFTMTPFCREAGGSNFSVLT